MDKAALLRVFKTMVSSASSMAMSEKCKTLAVPLAGLKKIGMREACLRSQQLNNEVCYEGSVVYANICSSAALAADKHTVLCLVQDEQDEDVAALLHIFNALSASRQEDPELLFPPETRVAIKEPLCFSSVIRVSSPASLEFLGVSGIDDKPVQFLLKQGNALLAEGSFVLADLYYTQVLTSTEDSSVRKEALSGRAEARLQMGRYEESFGDAEAALEIGDENHHAASLMVKGKALTALQEHRLALPCFRLAGSRQDVEKSRAYVQQSELGEYNVTEYVTGRKQEPDCSDYFGALEMRMTEDGRGRGIYLTRDVKRGDLLMVCNPSAFAKSETARDAEKDLYVELVRACIASDRRLENVYGMADAAEMKTLPDLAPFQCNVGRVVPKRQHRELDIERIRRVSHRCGFTSKLDKGYISGVYASSGFFNHSCTPNASKVCFGKVMFIRAARNMRAGDEVMISYSESSVLAPLLERGKKYSFECKCRRCTLERDNKRILASFKYNRRPVRDKLHKETALEWALDAEKRMRAKDFSDEEKNWIRAGLVELYSEACIHKHTELPTPEGYLRILHDTVPGNFETLSKMVQVYDGNGGGGGRCLDLLHEGVVALFGEQPQQVKDIVIKSCRMMANQNKNVLV